MADISLTQLSHFIALADTGSFTKGADRVLRSQAAFSRSIAVLEAELGAPLVDRIGHRNELTPFGRLILQHARSIMADVDALSRTSEEYARGSGGHFRLGLGATPSALLSVPLLAHVARHQRNLRITITSGPSELQLNSLREQQIDAMIAEARQIEPTPDLSLENITELPTGLLCRADHPLTRGGPLDLQQAAQYPFASTRMSEESVRFLMDWLGPQGHPQNLIAIQCFDLRSLLDVVESSDALFIGVVAAARDRIAAGRLVPIPLPVKTPASVFSIITLRGRARPLSFPTIRDIIRETLFDHLDN